MIITKTVKMRWHGRTKKYYESKGYIFTKYNDYFDCKVEDLPDYSTAKIKCLCDYCLKEGIETIIPKQWDTYVRQNKKATIHTDCCKKCSPKKHKEGMNKVYGVDSPMHLEEIRNKVSETHKTDFVKIEKEFQKRGYILLLKENEYKDAHQKIPYICPRHKDKGVLYITWNKFYNQHQGCIYCGYEAITGENSYMWKDGISPLHNYIRKKISQWKQDSMKNCSYRCILTGDKTFIIHHLYSFAMILEETLNKLNLPIYNMINKYTDEELQLIENTCLKLHYKYPLGVCLREDIHKLFHSLYGEGKNTPEQFLEFKERYYNGEFDNKLKEIN